MILIPPRSEFIFKSKKAFWWYEDGNKLAYASIDSSKVQRMTIVKYGAPSIAIPPPPASSLSSSTTSKLADNVRSLTSVSSTPKQAALSANTTIVHHSNVSHPTIKSTVNHHHPTIPAGPMNNLNNHLYSNVGYGNMMSNGYSSADSIYPKIVSYPYPKPGSINPTIHINIVDLQSNTRNHKQISPPREISKMWVQFLFVWFLLTVLSCCLLVELQRFGIH